GNPLVVDVAGADAGDNDDDRLRHFLTALGSTECQAAVICHDQARTVRLLGRMSYELLDEAALPIAGRVAAARAAANGTDAYLSEESALVMVNRYPLQLDGLEHAMYLARSRPKHYGADDPALARFMTACKDVAAESLS